MDLDVAPAKESEIDQLMEVQSLAFKNDPYHEALFPGDHFSPAIRKAAGERTIIEWLEDPSILFIKCTDKRTGAIVGYAKHNVYEAERPKAEGSKNIVVDWCTRRQKEVAENFLGATTAVREKIWGGKPHLFKYFHSGLSDGLATVSSSSDLEAVLNIFCVHKAHPRQGAGILLVQ